jgi:hypothetical protein
MKNRDAPMLSATTVVGLTLLRFLNGVSTVSARRTHLEFVRGVDNDAVHVRIGGHDDKREDSEPAALQR